MRKKLSLRIMIPLLLIFILTLTVNMSVTQKMQSVRENTQQILDSDIEMSDEIKDTLDKNITDISSGLSVNGLLSSCQLFMVIVTIFITLLTIVRPLKKIKVQLDDIVTSMEDNKGDLRVRVKTKMTDEI